MMVYGGETDDGADDSLWSFNTTSFLWNKVTCPKEAFKGWGYTEIGAYSFFHCPKSYTILLKNVHSSLQLVFSPFNQCPLDQNYKLSYLLCGSAVYLTRLTTARGWRKNSLKRMFFCFFFCFFFFFSVTVGRAQAPRFYFFFLLAIHSVTVRQVSCSITSVITPWYI